MEKYKDIKEEFRRIGKFICDKGLNNSHSGNMSVRLGDKILITRRGSMLGFLKEDDIIETGLDKDDFGITLASSEVNVHRAILKNTSALAVIHTHLIHAVVLSFNQDEIIPLDAEGGYVLKKIPVIKVEFGCGSKEMEEKVSKVLKKFPIVVVRGHGAFSIGKTLEESLDYASILEDISKIIYKVKTLGINTDNLTKETLKKW
ncbi:MAG: aldolase [Candidatus Firestonebacteria bacterium]